MAPEPSSSHGDKRFCLPCKILVPVSETQVDPRADDLTKHGDHYLYPNSALCSHIELDLPLDPDLAKGLSYEY